MHAHPETHTSISMRVFKSVTPVVDFIWKRHSGGMSREKTSNIYICCVDGVLICQKDLSDNSRNKEEGNSFESDIRLGDRLFFALRRTRDNSEAMTIVIRLSLILF
jgi:hypothetical protein